MNRYKIIIDKKDRRIIRAESAPEAWRIYRNLPVFGINRMVDPEEWGSDLIDADTRGREWLTTSYSDRNLDWHDVCVERIPDPEK